MYYNILFVVSVILAGIYAAKSEEIIRMHDNLIVSIATLVESRDNSTGGHIKRTSDVVKILVEEIMNDKSDDALVSKRFYKEKLSFEEADKIIMESMGRHFDKQLEKYYLSAREKLQAYYSKPEV